MKVAVVVIHGDMPLEAVPFPDRETAEKWAAERNAAQGNNPHGLRGVVVPLREEHEPVQ